MAQIITKVTQNLQRIKEQFESTKREASEFSISELENNPEARKIIEIQRRKCAVHGEELLRQMFELDGLTEPTDEVRATRKALILEIQSIIDASDTVNNELKKLISQLPEPIIPETKTLELPKSPKPELETSKHEESPNPVIDMKVKEKINEKDIPTPIQAPVLNKEKETKVIEEPTLATKSIPKQAQNHKSNNFYQPKINKPLIDVTEDANKYKIIAILPVINREDISLELQDDTITLSAPISYGFDNIRKRERIIPFTKSFIIPRDVDNSNISAKFTDEGTLEIILPKYVRRQYYPHRFSVMVN